MKTTKLIRRLPPAPHMMALRNNLQEVNRLLEIHRDISGAGPGRKRYVQVLNKSALVLLLACWEAYIEDTAKNCFEFMLKYADDPKVFPDHVLAIAAKQVKQSDATRLWAISGDGWKDELQRHRDAILNRYIVKGSFNTPSAENIDRLFSELVGLTSLSRNWHWPKMSHETAKNRLRELIELRGSIAHRVEASRTVYKKDVEAFKTFIMRLAVITHNMANALICERIEKKAWRRYKHGQTA